MLTSLAWMRSRFATPSTAKGKTGPSWPKTNTGGDSAALRYRLARKQGLQGLRFAPGGAGQWEECPMNAGLWGMAATQPVRTWVRTRFAGLHPGYAKNGQG